MKTKDQIIFENSAAAAVSKSLRLVLVALAITLFMSLVLNVFSLYALRNWFPIKQFVWTQDARAVCEAITLDQPNVSDARVRNMAADAAIELNSYDYLNWRRQIQNAMNAYLTTNAQRAYSTALSGSNTIKRVEQGYYTVSALLGNKPPRIAETGMLDGRFYWKVEVPLVIYYRTPEVSKPESRVLVMTVVRVDPSFINPNGIAIDGITSTQEVSR
ncbi:DotI/IcmL family type IV secretion protein (plasmid) [Agrobacterium rosae]|uniref:DotI/IcmL family type IV secretion protein n=1 Tax=Agrobacterium rosae TaxID=1972867 RepID=A0AAW9FL60_9HYPH|nr:MULTISPECIES: DotI/IcmL family type IV secretion protein [Agrobacterium]MCF1501575.1 hypothetical protein [Allorhizobium sp. Av2]MDX8321705.1 DotI/IcmL family type IV secretion protein [Agrobacterium sp. rho-8.1]MDX8305168.1 DotI/IcmL family type IV secretion protein [Agrobacterium rosae]MDX8311452.1 DotI/IcmL family type IV secretion protein [Agrobacterium sp. rho-13.3]MDX8316316.1 DotI/IcmL family type IV secretion protein [Agrobacterium rosae]